MLSPREQFIALLSNQPLRSGDVLFLAEGDGYHRISHTAELFKKSFAPVIATMGGDTRREYGSYPSGELELKLVETGVPENAIVCEETAPHTKAEADRMMELASEAGWKRILLVTSPHHQYRMFLTFLQSMRAAGLDLILINAPAPLSWFASNPWGRRADLLEGEFERIEGYQKKGDVATYAEGIEYLKVLESRI